MFQPQYKYLPCQVAFQTYYIILFELPTALYHRNWINWALLPSATSAATELPTDWKLNLLKISASKSASVFGLVSQFYIWFPHYVRYICLIALGFTEKVMTELHLYGVQIYPAFVWPYVQRWWSVSTKYSRNSVLFEPMSFIEISCFFLLSSGTGCS